MTTKRQRHKFPDLPGVFITGDEGVIVEEDSDLGTCTGYERVAELEKEIATALCLRHRPLTGREFRFVRCAMGLSRRALGEIVAREEQAIKIWEDKHDNPVDATFSRTLKQEFLAYIGKREWITETLAHPDEGLPDGPILMTLLSLRWTSNIKMAFLARSAVSHVSEPKFVTIVISNKTHERLRVWTSHLDAKRKQRSEPFFSTASPSLESNTPHTENLTQLLVKEYVDNKENGMTYQ